MTDQVTKEVLFKIPRLLGGEDVFFTFMDSSMSQGPSIYARYFKDGYDDSQPNVDIRNTTLFESNWRIHDNFDQGDISTLIDELEEYILTLNVSDLSKNLSEQGPIITRSYSGTEYTFHEDGSVTYTSPAPSRKGKEELITETGHLPASTIQNYLSSATNLLIAPIFASPQYREVAKVLSMTCESIGEWMERKHYQTDGEEYDSKNIEQVEEFITAVTSNVGSAHASFIDEGLVYTTVLHRDSNNTFTIKVACSKIPYEFNEESYKQSIELNLEKIEGVNGGLSTTHVFEEEGTFLLPGARKYFVGSVIPMNSELKVTFLE